VCEFDARDDRGILGYDQELLADCTVVRVVIRGVIDAEQMEGQQQPARRSDEDCTGRQQQGGSLQACELS
jgi:hypothetical protein